MIRSHTLVYR